MNFLKYYIGKKRGIQCRKPIIVDDSLFCVFTFDENETVPHYFGSKVICLNKNTFRLIWEFYYPFVINDILVTPQKTIICNCMDGILLIFDPITGEVLNSINSEIERIGYGSNISQNKLIVSGIQGYDGIKCLNLDTFVFDWSRKSSTGYLPQTLIDQ